MGAVARESDVVVEPHSSQRVEQVFNTCFAASLNTCLIGGADEPLYQPALAVGDRHALYYREDYFASALHEVAHWCIAGDKRRQQVDFGYWYAPEGRCITQQKAFETVEVKPQALEWYFSQACGYRFQVSADNIALANAGQHDVLEFQRNVQQQALMWQRYGLPERAAVFFGALCEEFATSTKAAQLCFALY